MLLGAALALVASALVLAACGGSGGGSSGESSTTASSGSGSEGSGTESGTETQGGPVGFEISEEDRQCLKEKGVELPEFKAGEGPQTFQRGEMPEGGELPEGGEMPEGGQMPEGGEPPAGGPAGAGGAMSEENKEAFEECGVEMPEFKAGPGGEGRPNVNSAAFKKQVKEYVACVRENGYELAEPDFSGEGPIFDKSESESAAFKKASEQCQSLLGGPQGSQSG
jgi:hypothetical protein